ncbi:MAG: T9SS type A sorting domain-containing protein [Saprospiraceae bacterium]|nr:T9SS type A sorting domain-containing protein [Saprospiraceae bacterium]
MDAMIKRALLLAICSICWIASPAQQMNWTMFTEDTVYYARDYLPDHRVVTMSGPAQVWDLRTLKAPYALSRRIIQSGEREGKMYANLVNGKQTDAIMRLTGKLNEMIQIIEDNPVCEGSRLTFTLSPAYKPFYNGVMGESYTYKGKMTSVFAWPRNMTCNWTPPLLPDSCRVTITIAEETVVDGQGTLYLPIEVQQVNRHSVSIKRAIKVETRTGMLWRDITTLVPGIRLITSESYIRFVSSTTGLQLVDIELNDAEVPLSIEFKTHPMVTRVFTEEPVKADVFAYPNPSYDIVRFQLSDLIHGKYKLKIFNILGVQMKEVDIDVDNRRETIAVDLSDMQRGTYLYRLQDKFGRTIRTKRIVLIQS